MGDSNGVGDVATAIAVVHTLVESADTHDLDDLAQPYQIDGHKKAISGASTAHAVPQVVGILGPEMGSREHGVVIVQQQDHHTDCFMVVGTRSGDNRSSGGRIRQYASGTSQRE